MRLLPKYAATAVTTPYVIAFIVLVLGIPVEATVGLVIGGAIVAIGGGWGINSIAERLGIKQVLYEFLVNSSMAQVYRKQAEEDPEWVPWYF